MEDMQKIHATLADFFKDHNQEIGDYISTIIKQTSEPTPQPTKETINTKETNNKLLLYETQIVNTGKDVSSVTVRVTVEDLPAESVAVITMALEPSVKVRVLVNVPSEPTVIDP